VAFVTVCVCLSVRAVKGKRLELSTPYLVHHCSCRSACIDLEVKRSKIYVSVAWLLVKCAAVAVVLLAAAGVGLHVV